MKANEVLITCEYKGKEPVRARLANDMLYYKKGDREDVPLPNVMKAIKFGFEVVEVAKKVEKKTAKKD